MRRHAAAVTNENNTRLNNDEQIFNFPRIRPADVPMAVRNILRDLMCEGGLWRGVSSRHRIILRITKMPGGPQEADGATGRGRSMPSGPARGAWCSACRGGGIGAAEDPGGLHG